MDLHVWSYPGSGYIYSKFHRNSFKGFFGGKGFRNLPCFIDLAIGLNKSLYYRRNNALSIGAKYDDLE